MANEFVARNGIIAKDNSTISGTLAVSGNITMGGTLVATRTWVTGTALTGYATESYVTTAINNLIDSAPGALNTLNELAAALGDDPNFATTITNSIATKVSKAGDTMTGNINWGTSDRGLTWAMNTDGAYIKFYNTGDGDTNSRLEYGTSDNGNEFHRWMVSTGEEMTLKSDGLRVTDSIWMGGNLVATQSWVTSQNYLTTIPGEYLTQTEGDALYAPISHTHSATDITSGTLAAARLSGNYAINVTGSAATLTTARTLTIGNTGKTFNGSANVSWTLAEIGAQAAGSYLTTSIGGTIDVNAANGTSLFTGSTNTWTNRGPLVNNAGALFSINTHPGNYYSQFWFDTAGGGFYHRTANNVLPTAAWQRVYADDYHPVADTWTTARTITIGSTGKSVNGSANVSWSLAEIGALGVSAKAADSELLDGIDSSGFIRDYGTSAQANINTIGVTSGKYRWNSSTVGRPAEPQTNEYGTLLHLNYDGDVTTQLAYDIAESNLYIRHLTTSTDTPSTWKRVVTSSDTIGILDGYTQLEVDNLIDSRAALTHTHSATDITSGTLASARLSGTYAISISGNATTATTLATARTLTIGNTGKTFNGSANVSWTLAEIGAQPAGSYLTAEADTLATVTGRGATTSTTLTLARVVTTGLYGPSTAGNIPIWQYDAANTGYGIIYAEGTPDLLRIDVSGQALTGTPDFLIGPNYAQVNGNDVWHAGNDGSGSGLDADLLDGQQGSYYLDWTNVTNKPDPVITLAGAVTGAATMTDLGSITITTTATSDPVLTLAGDATGSATFTNLGNATLTVTVVDDSHTHDGRYYTETESDARFVNVTGDTVTGDLTVSGAALGVISTTAGSDAFYVDGVNGRLFTVTDSLDDSLFSVNTVAGLPVIEAFADNTVKLGPFTNPVTISSTGILSIGGLQAATQSYVDTAITNLIGGAPGALDTLNELAAAINDDASYASTITSALALKAPLASPALTGTPTAPTAVTATNSTQIATTAFVKNQGYITGYTETDTLASVTGRGASTSTSVSFTSAGKVASFGTNSNNPNATIASQTNYIQIVAAGATQSMGLVFHNAGISTSALEFVNTDANTGYFNFRSDDSSWNVRVNNNTVWHAGNDGSGSGLDADLLDGNHASAFYLATNPAGYTTNTGTVTSVSGTGSYGGLTLSGTVTSSGSITLGGTPTGTWPISISGNADTVDNLHASSFLRSDTYNSNYGGLQVFRNIGSINGSWPDTDHTFGLENDDAGNIVINFHRAGYTSHNLRYTGTGFRFDLALESTGVITASGGNSTNWNTAYGWGNHAGLYLGISDTAADSNKLGGLAAASYYLASNPSGYITSSSNITGTSAGVVRTVTGTTSAELVRGNMGDNDQARILVGATASNAGYLEIATADDGTEPIYVRQYTGVFSTLTRTATLLDGSGNTSFPGTVTASTFSGALSGNATTATTLQTIRSINGTNFNGSANITTATWGTARTITIGSTGKSVNGGADVSWTLAEIGAAAASHNHTSLTGVTSIEFAAQSSDTASISTTISGTSTFFDFNLTDDNNNDWWRWRFTPSGSTVYDAMTLKPLSNGNADLTISGSVFADNLAISNWNTAYGWGNHAGLYLGVSDTAVDSNKLGGIAAASYALLASPALTGTPTAPTATAGTNTTQIATTAFVQTAVSNLIDAAPATLDTLNELAAALGDDPNFATTVSTNIGTKVSKTGDTMTGSLTIDTGAIGSSTAAFNTYDRLIFNNQYSDTFRGPNKITLYADSTWIGGFGIQNDTVAYYSGGTHKWYKSASTTSFTQTMSLDASGNLVTAGTISATNFSGSSSGTNTGDQTTITGNAGSATVLQTARTINGTSFDGSANITTANWGTARTLTVGNTGKSVNGSTDVSWTLGEIGAAAASHSHFFSDITDIRKVFNNFGDVHTTFQSFDSVADFGPFFIQNTAAGPGTGSSQFYGLALGLGSDYAYGSYALQVAIPRYGSSDKYLSFRTRENGTWAGWSKFSAGYADSAGSATTATTATTTTGNAGSATVLQTARTLTIGNTGKTFNGSANVSWTLAEIGAQAAGSYLATTGGNLTGNTSVSSGISFLFSGISDTNWRIGRNIVAESGNNLTSNTLQFIAAAAAGQGWQFVGSTGITRFEIDASTGNAWFNGGNVLPNIDRTQDLGAESNRWLTVYCQVLDSAGLHEANLAKENISDYETGTVLVWKGGEMVPCSKTGDHMRMGVAVKGMDSPLVQGAEPVLCTGDVEEGQYLITSEKLGHAIGVDRSYVVENQLFDCVIGKALESKSGESFVVKTWVNI